MRKSTFILCMLSITLLSPKLFAELDKEKVKEIAKQYVDACENANEQDLQNLFSKETTLPSHWKHSLSEIKKMSIKKVDGNNVLMKIRYRSTEREASLQLLEDGTIKYDPIFFHHPIADAFFNYGQLIVCLRFEGDSDLAATVDLRIEGLTSTGIPLFGLSSQQKIHEQRKSLENILEWLLENGETWDKSDPKVPCSEDVYDKYKRMYK